MYMSIFIIIWLNKKLILINKFIKHNKKMSHITRSNILIYIDLLIFFQFYF
jgi:hypothetical protein